MTTQQIRVVELVESIRRKRLRNENPTNLITSTPVYSNWGNKLKRSAQYVEEGHLDNPRGASTQYEDIIYNGFKRRIISRNPLLIDEDGDLVDEEDETNELDLEPIEDDPYKDIRLDDILQPLTSVADLHLHPRMSRPYIDKGLDEMIRKTEESLRKEQRILAAMNELLIKARGDYDWAPVGTMHTSYDDTLLRNALHGTPAAKAALLTNGTSTTGNTDEETRTQRTTNEEEAESPGQQLQLDTARADEAAARLNGTTQPTNGTKHSTPEHTDQTTALAIIPSNEETSESDAPSRRMTTRQQTTTAIALSSRSPSPPQIHPFYIGPPHRSTQDDPLLSLLQYVSKQEEVVRLHSELYQNLLRAARMRREVATWAKAEGHVGEMSDGEDWVDLDAWGLLPGELTKGKEEEDVEVVNEGTGRRGRRGGRGAGDR